MKDKVKFWLPQAEKWAKQTGTPAALILAVIEMESGGQPFVTRYEPEYQKNYVDGNKKNMAITRECGLTHEQVATSYGLMQLMFPLAYGYGARSIKVLLDPDQNIRFGAAHLGMLIKKYGGTLDGACIRAAAGAYNGARAGSAYARGVFMFYIFNMRGCLKMGDMTRDFSRKEFSCKCGCGFDAIKPELVQTVQTIRGAAGAPVFINSGCRCPEHNKAVGGIPNSSHLSGYAADIYISGWGNIRLGNLIKKLYSDGKLPYLKYCYRIGGTTRTAVHIDADGMIKRTRTFGF